MIGEELVDSIAVPADNGAKLRAASPMTVTSPTSQPDDASAGPLVRMEKNGALLTLRREYADRLFEMGIEEPAAMIERAGGEAVEGGRGAVFLVPFGEERLVVRHCRRGGLFGRLLRDVYLGRGRALTELSISGEAADRGILTPEIVAVVQRRAFGPTFRSDIVSLEIREAITVGEYIAWYPATTTRDVLREKRQVIEAAAVAVRRMHGAGLVHGDLNVNNLMLRRRSGEVEVSIIDLDGSRLLDKVTPPQRRRELMRLGRSLMKMRLKPCPVDNEDRLRFLRSYGEELLEMSPRAMLKACARQVAVHRVFWFLLDS